MAATDFFNDTSQFDVARKRAATQSTTNLQARKDALTRRFANLGNLDSGARLKLEEKAANEESQNLAQNNEGIDAAQQTELRRRGEIKQGQDYTSGEAAKQRDFGAAEALKQRSYLTGEREAGQKFASGERLAGQGFMSSERQAGQKFAGDENTKNREMAMKQLMQAQDQFDKTFGEEVRINNKNLEFAEWMKNQKGPLDQLGSSFNMGSLGTSGMDKSLWGQALGMGDSQLGVSKTIKGWF